MLNKPVNRRSFLTISTMTAAACALDWSKLSAYAAKMKLNGNFPVVVVGAGLGGLTCGAYLAKLGIPVTVVEQHSIPGGYATAFDRAGGKFTFDVSLHGTSIHNNASARMLQELGVLEKVELIPLPEVYRYKTPDFEISVPQKDSQAYIDLLSRHFPEEADGIRQLVTAMVGLAEEVDRLDQKKGKFFKPLFPIQYAKMWNIRNKTLADFLDDYVKNPKLKNTLSALWGYYGLPPERLSGFYYANATGEYLKNGSYYIKERSQDLSYALADVIETHGGEIMYDTSAERIVLKNGLITGVQLSDGKTLDAKAVASNADALTTVNQMLPPEAVPVEYRRKLEQYRPSISCFLVWLGLNRPIAQSVKGFSTHISTGLDPETDYEMKIKGDIGKGSYGIAVYDNVFKGYSAPESSTLQLIFLCGYEPWRRFETDYKAGKKDAYNGEKNRWAETLIRRAERDLIPELSSMIQVRESATPLTCWRYTRNPEGAIYGFEQSMDNAFMNRIKTRTPIKGLYLASAWGSPGGGYIGVMRSGQSAFKAIIEDFSS